MRYRSGLLPALVLSAFFAPAAIAADHSGPKVGSQVKAFDVHDITGSQKGKTLCYV